MNRETREFRSDIDNRELMRENRELNRKKQKRIQERRKQVRLNRLLILVLVILLVSIGLVYGQRRKIRELNKAYNEQVESQKRLKERVDALQSEIKEANTLEYIEKKAREELGMIKKSEKIYLEEDSSKEKSKDNKNEKTENKEKDEKKSQN